MKYLKLYESWLSKKIHNYKIQEICEQYNIKNYTINKDGSIDVSDAIVYLHCEKLTKIPLKFNKINNFFCYNNKLISLKGAPVEVYGHFYCRNNKLTSFQYSPKIIRRDFDCEDNNIKSFEYFPSFIGRNFFCGWNPINVVWKLFEDTKKIELLNDFDIFRDEDTETPGIVMDRLNDFLLTIGLKEVEKVDLYKNI